MSRDLQALEISLAGWSGHSAFLPLAHVRAWNSELMSGVSIISEMKAAHGCDHMESLSQR